MAFYAVNLDTQPQPWWQLIGHKHVYSQKMREKKSKLECSLLPQFYLVNVNDL